MWNAILDMLVLLVVVNGAPIIAARVFAARYDTPVDLGARLPDGRPLFGSSKTWRGLAAAALSCTLVAPLLGYSAQFGLVFSCLAMAGDLGSSFLKRRLGLNPSDQCLGVDQIPEALLPCMYTVTIAGLPWWLVILVPLLFMALELLVSRPLYHLKIRKRPY